MSVDAYVWFIVKSAGEYSAESGFKYSRNGDFDPQEFTSVVKQSPRECWKIGDKRTSSASTKVQETCHTSSAWLSERVEAEGSDVIESATDYSRDLNLISMRSESSSQSTT